MKKKKIAKVTAVALCCSMLLSMTATANDPPPKDVRINPMLVCGDILERSENGEQAGMSDALQVLRFLVKLSTPFVVSEHERPYGLKTAPSQLIGGSSICESENCSLVATKCGACVNIATSSLQSQLDAKIFELSAEKAKYEYEVGEHAKTKTSRDSWQSQYNDAQETIKQKNDLIKVLEDLIGENPDLQAIIQPYIDAKNKAEADKAKAEGERDALQKQWDEHICTEGPPIGNLQDLLEKIAELEGQVAGLIQERDNWKANYDNHMATCNGGSTADPLGPVTTVPAHNPRSGDKDIARRRITDPSDNVWHISFASGMFGSMIARDGGGKDITDGHFVRFNDDGDPKNTLMIRRGGTYVINTGGATLDVKIYVNAHDRPWRDLNPTLSAVAEPVVIILNGANITSSTGAAIHSRRSQYLEVRVADGTTNNLTDGATYLTINDPEANTDPPPEPSAVIFSQGDIRVTGRGTLNITSRLSEQRWRRTGGAKGDATQMVPVLGRGIESRDTVTIGGAELNINTTNTDTAIHGRDGVTITAGKFRLRAGNHGIRASNTSSTNPTFGNITITGGVFDIEHQNDGIKAENTQKMTGGTFDRIVNMKKGTED
ncbi:MAG: carbohydrate-binding domain-containing protein [Oscillospiraceae bacterium]|nr:carbohydrate-binding domain-containing protein [Oscillospiraceae bacterium]